MDAVLTTLSWSDKIISICHLLDLHLWIHFTEPSPYILFRSEMLLTCEAIFWIEWKKMLSYVVHLNHLGYCQSHHCTRLILSDQYPKPFLCGSATKSYQCSKPVSVVIFTSSQGFVFKPTRNSLITISKKCNIPTILIT